MKICINGKPRVTSASTIEKLLAELNLLPAQIAVEHNGTVLFRQELAQTSVCDGDKIEIVRVVAGG